jgi:glycosyltransferase involved in cell wall biosynthesis
MVSKIALQDGPVKSRVLVISSEPIGARLAGPAIRSMELAGVLERVGHKPIVTAPDVHRDTPPAAFPIVRFEKARAAPVIGPLLSQVDVVLLHPHALFEFPFIRRTERPIVVDLYDPVLFESLELDAANTSSRKDLAARTQVAILRGLLHRGDFFLCASERQRDFWLGALVIANRVNATTVQDDPALRGLIETVPFGIPSIPPRRSTVTVPSLKGVGPMRQSDKVVLWGGGIWDWLDPLTLIRAFARVAAVRDDVHLVFLGTTRPDASAPPMRMVSQARSLAESLGLAGSRIQFREGWVPYAERGALLLDADVGVTTHTQHLEARFAFRTRVLDYVWAGLPIVCTRGDVMADLVDREGLGIVVPECDETALATGLERMLSDEPFVAACRERLERVAPRLFWGEVAKPFVRFCDSPRLAPDRRRGARALPHRAGALGRRAMELLHEGGPRALALQAWRRLRLCWR